MLYFLENPLKSKVTVFEKSEITDFYNEGTYTKKVLECAIFEGKTIAINKEGKNINSFARIAVKEKIADNSMIFLGETLETTPPTTSQEVIKITTARDTEQNIEGYWIWV